MSIEQANRISLDIGHDLLVSMKSPQRYPRGTVGYAEGQFIADTVATLISASDHPDNQHWLTSQDCRPKCVTKSCAAHRGCDALIS
jgi:hypothetical protein